MLRYTSFDRAVMFFKSLVKLNLTPLILLKFVDSTNKAL